ncbi:MAG: hypothetical protein KJZ64_14660 [Sphingomonadaceae bacterium]|nr:hypothetical protein [Sphingomonadaceae bacterium]
MSDIKVSFPSPCSEPWEGMAPAGCHRHCASCDKVIHNLEAMTVEEVEGLVASGEEVCVRARVAADGTVALADGTGRGRRKLVAVVGATMALAACQTPLVGPVSPRYQVTVDAFGWVPSTTLRLVAEDGTAHRPGRTRDGRFRFGNLRPGTYTPTVEGRCGDTLFAAPIEIRDADIDAGKLQFEDGQDDCIIIGVMSPIGGWNG